MQSALGILLQKLMQSALMAPLTWIGEDCCGGGFSLGGVRAVWWERGTQALTGAHWVTAVAHTDLPSVLAVQYQELQWTVC